MMTPEYPALAERDSIHTRIALEAKIVCVAVQSHLKPNELS